MNEREIFQEALDQTDSAQREAFLDRVCAGDAALRTRIEALLSSHASDSVFLKVPALQQIHPANPEADATITVHGNREDDATDETIPDDESNDLPFLKPSSRSDSLGRLGQYEVLKILGKGGFGIVFRAFDEVLQRVVAVKVLAPQMASHSPARKRFLREAQSSARVRHDNVVQVYQVEEEPLPFLVMEFVHGETLQQRLGRKGPLDASEVVQIGRQIAEGLAAAHATGLIHRDIKPANIMIASGPHEQVKITDFGLARAADDASLTQSGVVAGTPMYMAPEQASADALDHRADLFSLGSVLYTICSGRPPFRASSTLAVLKRVVDDTPRPIREIIPETPEWLCDVISKLHAKNPDDRYQSARELSEALANAGAQPKAITKVKDDSGIPPAKPRLSPRRKWITTAALLLLPVIALAVAESAGVTHLFRSKQQTNASSALASVPAPADDQDGPAIDLIPLALLDPALGTWKRDGDTLLCTPSASNGGFLTLPIPVDLPSEYKFEAVFERLAGDEFVALHSAAFGKRFNVGIDCFAGEGSWSGLADIDNQDFRTNGTGTHGARIINSQPYTLRCIVRSSGIVATLNDQLLVNYAGGFDKLSDGNFAGPRLYFMAHGGITCRIHSLRLTPLAPKVKKETDPLPPTFKNSIGMEFVIVPKGKSWLGGSNGKEGDKEVAIPADFYLGKYEVTQEEWQKIMGENPSHFARTGNGKDAVKDISDTDSKRFPVENVTWDRCQLFVAKLNQQEKETGWVYRLPTQTEWEYACRGGPMSDKLDVVFDFYLAEPTNVLLPEQLNFDKGLNRTSMVGSYPPNRLGLHDMHGNVWEFCENPRQEPNDMVKRVSRGGSWRADARDCRVMILGLAPPQFHDESWGLRLARVRVPVSNDADRSAAEYVLSIGGTVSINDEGSDRDVASLPSEVFRLTRIDFRGSNKQVSDTGLAVFKDCTNLSVLNLEGTPVSDAGLAHFKKCKDLKLAWLGFTKVTDAGLTLFKDRKNLTDLNLGETQTSDAGMAYLKDCKKLRNLWLQGTQVGDNGLIQLRDFKELTQLQLERTGVTAAGIEQLKKNVPQAKIFWDGGLIEATASIDPDSKAAEYVLSIGGTVRVNGEDRDQKNSTELPREPFRLTGVVLVENKRVTDAGLANFKDCTSLTRLHLGGTQVTDAGLANFKDCKNLAHLILGGTQVTDAGLANFKSCKDLTLAWLGLTRISDAGLAHFKDCKKLTAIKLGETQAWSTSKAARCCEIIA